MVVYNGCNYVTSLREHVGTCFFAWERRVPFVPAMIVPYWSLDFFFMASPLLMTTAERLRVHAQRIATAICLAGLCFLLFPLTLDYQRPAVAGWLGSLFDSLDNFHNFYNCAPSLHIALCTLLWPVYVRRTPLGALVGVWFLLIAASVSLVWQHQILDVWTGFLLGLLCLHLYPTLPRPHPEASVSPRIGGRYGVAALAILAATRAGWPAGMLLLWPALSVALVALAYLGRGPAWLGKRDGELPFASFWLLAPYRWGATLSAGFFNRGRPPAVEVVNGLWVGRIHSRAEAAASPCQAVLDMTAEMTEPVALRERIYANIPVLDLTPPPPSQLAEAVAFIATQRAAGRTVLVHCALGLGRSCAVAIAYLISSGSTVDDAVARMRAAQPRLALSEKTLALLRRG